MRIFGTYFEMLEPPYNYTVASKHNISLQLPTPPTTWTRDSSKTQRQVCPGSWYVLAKAESASHIANSSSYRIST